MSAAQDAACAAALFAVDPAGLGGVCLRSLVQPARGQWLEMLRDLLPAGDPMRRIPFNISDGRLLGGLDLTATLAANRPIAERGALAAAHGGVVILSMAERVSAHTAACLNAVLDGGAVITQREGVLISDPARLGLVLQDESMDEERVPASLLDRLAFLVDLNGFDLRTCLLPLHEREQVQEARRLLPQVQIEAELIAALCGTGLALGAGTPRVSILAVRAARAMAALDGRSRVCSDDAAAAGRLVFAPRATRVPNSRKRRMQRRCPAPHATISPRTPRRRRNVAARRRVPRKRRRGPTMSSWRRRVRQFRAACCRGCASRPRRAAAPRRRGVPARCEPAEAAAGPPGSKWERRAAMRGSMSWRPCGPRRRGSACAAERRAAKSRVLIQPGDFRTTRYLRRSQTLTIFAVDASGSSALNRLTEAKGAVELLLADCYVRRDLVAVISFRGRRADVLLPPTRSLVRAKRNLAGMPGGGGTPLASAIECAALLGGQAKRRGETPLLVLLTDGRANVALDGSGGRDAAHADALQAARRLRCSRIAALFIDTSPRPSAAAAEVATAMHAEYLPLPFADARALSSVVSAATTRAAR